MRRILMVAELALFAGCKSNNDDSVDYGGRS